MIVTDLASVPAAAVAAAVGLALTYPRLRPQFDRVTAALCLALLAGATPLLHVVASGAWVDATLFAAMAAIGYASTYVRNAVARAAVVVVPVIIVPLLAPDTSAPPTLFSPQNGFLALTPMVYVGVIGTLVRFRTAPGDSLALLVALIVWPLADTTLVPTLALIGPGLAAVLAFAQRRPLVAAAPIVLAVVAWNYWLMVQYTAGTIPKDAPVSFAAMVRQQADVHTRQPYVYPFAFPGNWIAARQAGIPLARYDQLSAEPQDTVFEVRLDRAGDRFLLDGWGPLRATAAGSFRAIADGEADVIVPLRAASRDLEIVVVAATDPASPADATLNVRINGKEAGQGRIISSAPTELRIPVPAHDVGRLFRAGYNRVTLVSPGSRLGIYRLRIAPAA